MRIKTPTEALVVLVILLEMKEALLQWTASRTGENCSAVLCTDGLPSY